MIRGRYKLAMSAVVTLFFLISICAKKLNSSPHSDPSQRIQIALERVFKSFLKAGIKPVDHKLTPAEIEKINKAFALLPPSGSGTISLMNVYKRLR